MSGFRCPKCTHPDLRKCGREFCSFWAPLKDWKIKAGGVPGKWCERCCDLAVKKSARVKERKQQADDDDSDGYVTCTVYRTRAERDAMNERAGITKFLMTTCPDCKKEMQRASLPRHKNKSCKGTPAD